MVMRNTNIILSGADPEFISENMDEAITQLLTAGKDLADLVTEIAADRAAHPQDDVITALASANIDGEQLTPAELGSFFILLVVAGNETTRTAISHALNLLTEHPDQRELLLADLEGRLPVAVEEIVRYVSPVIWMRRSVTRDCTLNGHDYREGDKAVLFYWAANRDESVFADPGKFDITRTPNPHVGFGAAGPHFCLGAHWPAARSRPCCASCSPECRLSAPPGSRTGCCPPSSTASSTCRVSSTERRLALPPGTQLNVAGRSDSLGLFRVG